MNRRLSEIRKRTALLGDAERLLYSMSVADLAQKPAFVCFADTTVRKAAQMMADAGAASIFQSGQTGRRLALLPTGIWSTTSWPKGCRRNCR
jgi:hypothetical protein